ncbi:hypothetical protein WN73_11950 [Bradyrhizobium sp. CCBAU 45394]|nr:hypothetical protein [Bradyrhizobium sp. CCBAU 45394]
MKDEFGLEVWKKFSIGALSQQSALRLIEAWKPADCIILRYSAEAYWADSRVVETLGGWRLR